MAFVIVPAVIAIDVLLGFRFRSAWVFSVFQCLYFVAAYFWVREVHGQQDVSGPFAFILAIGVWGILVFLFHAWLFFRIWLSQKTRD